jgi:endonuclease/exonuclease/phosphatase family metal-dependent hydrolase
LPSSQHSFRIVFAVFSMALPLVFLVGCAAASKKNAGQTQVAKWVAQPRPVRAPAKNRSLPPLPTFEELQQLANDPAPSPALASKLERLFTQPVIDNGGKRSLRPHNAVLGDFLRIASWNVEKSYHTLEAIQVLKSEEAFKARLKPQVLADPAKLAEALRQRERLLTADVLLLQEMDVGMPRSGYLDAAREFAKALGMNYSFATQQIEVDPVTLGLEPGAPAPDPKRYKGLFGIAVLSKYPILDATCFQLKHQPYDWHLDERMPLSLVEKCRRWAAKVLVHSDIKREMKIGGRIFYRVDLHVPGLPHDTLSIIHNHLEIKTTVKGREQQLNEILGYIHPIPHSVIMAGDHNSAHTDVSATTLKRLTQRTSADPQTWVNVATNLLSIAPDGISLARTSLNATKNLHNPLAINIPFIFPNRARRLFDNIEQYRFADGGRFDQRGDDERSINGISARFANSNEHYWKGLRPTFRVPRPIGPMGKTRLDWIFVKAPSEWQGSYRFAPHFGETLELFDKALQHPLSDHRPIVADLPFAEPAIPVPTAD